MINPSFKELSEIADSRYEICKLVSDRADRLVDGAEPLIKNPKGESPVTIALEELIAGKVWKKEDEK